MKRGYRNVSNKLGNAIVLNSIFKTLVGVNIGAILTEDDFTTKLAIFGFGLFCLLGLNVSAKYIELNTPSKKHVSQIEEDDKRK